MFEPLSVLQVAMLFVFKPFGKRALSNVAALRVETLPWALARALIYDLLFNIARHRLNDFMSMFETIEALTGFVGTTY